MSTQINADQAYRNGLINRDAAIGYGVNVEESSSDQGMEEIFATSSRSSSTSSNTANNTTPNTTNNNNTLVQPLTDKIALKMLDLIEEEKTSRIAQSQYSAHELMVRSYCDSFRYSMMEIPKDTFQGYCADNLALLQDYKTGVKPKIKTAATATVAVSPVVAQQQQQQQYTELYFNPAATSTQISGNSVMLQMVNAGQEVIDPVDLVQPQIRSVTPIETPGLSLDQSTEDSQETQDPNDLSTQQDAQDPDEEEESMILI